LRNIFLTVNYLLKNFDTNIIIKESDKQSLYNKHLKTYFGDAVVYEFEENHDSHFHRTRIINDMIQMSNTKIIANYDADIILPIDSYIKSQMLLNIGYDIVYPFRYGVRGEKKVLFKDEFNFLEDSTKLVEQEFYKNNLEIDYLNNNFFYNRSPLGEGFANYGMCQFIKKDAYVDGFMENENFISYAPEDKERFYRFSVLEYKIGRIDECAYHMEHSRNHNSSISNPFMNKNEILWNHINSMYKEQLIEYYLKQEYFIKRQK